MSNSMTQAEYRRSLTNQVASAYRKIVAAEKRLNGGGASCPMRSSRTGRRISQMPTANCGLCISSYRKFNYQTPTFHQSSSASS